MRTARSVTRLACLAGTSVVLVLASAGAAAASETTVGGGSVTVPVPGCSTTVVAPSATFSVNPTTVSGTTGGATASCVS